MVNSINSNSGAFLGVRELNQTSSILDRTRERITTGRAVNGPKDDAATFAIAQALSGQIAGTTAVQGALSAGQAAVGVASTAATSVSNLLNDLRGVALQASQQNLDDSSRQALQTEFNGLVEQINTVAASANFGDVNLIQAGSSDLAVLADQSGSTIDVSAADLSSGGLGLDTLSLGSAADAQNALNSLDTAISSTSQTLTSFGTSAQRIDNQSDFTTTLTNSLQEGVGNLVDANLAQEAALLAAQEVRQVLGTQSLSIANSRPDSIRALFE